MHCPPVGMFWLAGMLVVDHQCYHLCPLFSPLDFYPGKKQKAALWFRALPDRPQTTLCLLVLKFSLLSHKPWNTAHFSSKKKPHAHTHNLILKHHKVLKALKASVLHTTDINDVGWSFFFNGDVKVALTAKKVVCPDGWSGLGLALVASPTQDHWLGSLAGCQR